MTAYLPSPRALTSLALFTLVACGGGGTEPAPNDVPTVVVPTPDPDPVPDTTAPSVLSTSPADGAVGLLSDAVVTITFSEPMDPESLPNAIDSSDLGAVTLSWNAAGDVLTLSPSAPLELATGPGDAELDALEYRVVLGTGATDLAGNPLPLGVSVAFQTARELWMTFPPDHALTRSLTPTDLQFGFDDPLVVGDDADDQGIRSTITFDLSFLPDEAIGVTDAVLATRQLIGDLSGTPWTDLGASVRLDHVSFVDLSTEAEVNAAFNGTQSSFSSTPHLFGDGQVVIEADVTSEVDDDLLHREERLARSQFLLWFQTPTELGGDVDRVVISRDLLELQVTYLVP